MPLCVQLCPVNRSYLPDPYRAPTEQLRRPTTSDLTCSRNHRPQRLLCTPSNGATAVRAIGRLSQAAPLSSGHHHRSAITICAATPSVSQLHTSNVTDADAVTHSYSSDEELTSNPEPYEEQSATETARNYTADGTPSGSCHTATNSTLPRQDTSRPAPEPGDLFRALHIAEWSLPLVIYFPLGCALASARMALWVLLLAADQPWLSNNDASIRVFLGLLGVRVVWHNTELIPSERHVLVSNHSTVGDLLVLYARPESYVHLVTARLPKRVTEANNHRVKLRHASGETYCSLADTQETNPIHLFPEGGMTNGLGMMRFSRGFMRFGQGLPVAPFALRVRCAFDISTHTLSSSFLANLFWFSFCPWIELDATVLPPILPNEGEGNGFFVKRVQTAIAEELNVQIVDLTQSQKQSLVTAAKKKL